jgi:hypothetical protein
MRSRDRSGSRFYLAVLAPDKWRECALVRRRPKELKGEAQPAPYGQLERLALRLHQLGPRALHEYLLELGKKHGLQSEIRAQLERYAEIDPDVLRALGGDRSAPVPIHIVRGGK